VLDQQESIFGLKIEKLLRIIINKLTGASVFDWYESKVGPVRHTHRS
jgi:hypothetical protein